MAFVITISIIICPFDSNILLRTLSTTICNIYANLQFSQYTDICIELVTNNLINTQNTRKTIINRFFLKCLQVL